MDIGQNDMPGQEALDPTPTEPKWQRINSDTERLKVVDGWLYRVIMAQPIYCHTEHGSWVVDWTREYSLCFVPDPPARPWLGPM